MGKPVVCTPRALGDLPGSHGHNCWIARSPRRLANGVLNLLQDGALARRLGHNARDTAMQHCSWDRAADELEALCVDLVRTHSPVRFDVVLDPTVSAARAHRGVPLTKV